MSEQAKVRLVRCPKCQNLLQELTDYSVYQCGGCDTVLRAKGMNGEIDGLSVKSDEDRVGGVLERFSQKSEDNDVYEKRMGNLSEASEDDAKSKDGSFSRERRLLNDGNENYGSRFVGRAGKRMVQDSNGVEKASNGISYAKMENEFEDIRPQIGNAMGLQRSRDVPDWGTTETEVEGLRRTQIIDEVGIRYSTQRHQEEERLNYQFHGRYGHVDQLQKRTETMEFDQVAYPGESRAELLRKLDEVKEQLSRSCELSDKVKENIVHDSRMVPQDPYGYADKWFPEDYSATNRASIPYGYPDKQAARPSYMDRYSKPAPSIDRHARVGYDFYPPTRTSGHFHELEDPLRPEMLRRHAHQAYVPYQQEPYNARFSGPYRNGNMVPVDSFESYQPTVNHHHPSCSCFQCYGKYQVPPQLAPNAYRARQFSDGAKDREFYHHEDQYEYAPRDHSAELSDPPSFQSHSSQSHARRPTDLKSEVSDYVHNRPSRMLVASTGRQCLPLAGGAPFLACQNCYELLQIPKKALVNNSNERKIRCGACSALIVLVVDTKRLDVTLRLDGSSNAEVNVINERYGKNLSEGSSYAHVHPNRASMNFSSQDYDNSGYAFQSMDREPGSVSTGERSSRKPGDIRNSRSVHSSSSDEEDKPETSAAIKDSNSADLPVKKAPPPPAGSSLQEYFEYSNKYHVVNRFGEGNRSGRSEPNKATLNKTTLRENSIKDGSATEIDISSNEYSNTGTSVDSSEVNKESGQNRAKKASESFFGGIMKKSFRDSNTSVSNVEPEKANVTVNGNLIPDRLIKKAEYLAGPIHPGHYWYDFRAGFWGVIGGPCFGIVPPFIEEFNYPIAENCSGGKTGVFVNGRELHQKDLKLLSSRGLPTERDKSYIVEISGRVLDEDTGEELKSLGKLAPTIEKLKRGFGMKDPRPMASR